LFFDLISAFKQDVVKTRYASFEELADYARLSANPVGRLILELFDIRDSEAFRYSDMVCSALQYANFLQDTGVDFRKGRIYLPLNELEKFSVGENLFDLDEKNVNIKSLMKFQVDRIENLFTEGKNLLKSLRGRLRFEISWTILGGLLILEKIRQMDYNVVFKRPVLTKKDFFILLCKAMVMR
jgi:phytoene/squalene synthetase